LLLTVDTREPAVVRQILRTLKIPFKVSKLPSGDFATDGCVFERKDITDMFQSMKGSNMRIGGRLFDQMNGMVDYALETGRVPFLVIVGPVERLREKLPSYVEVNLNALYGAIASVIVRYGINVLWLSDLTEALQCIWRIATKVHEGKRFLPHRKSLRLIHRDRRIAHVSNILRISPRIAERLLETYGSLRKILLADPKELVLIDGIGPVTVARLRALLDQ